MLCQQFFLIGTFCTSYKTWFCLVYFQYCFSRNQWHKIVVQLHSSTFLFFKQCVFFYKHLLR